MFTALYGGKGGCGAEGHVCINEIRLYLKCVSVCVFSEEDGWMSIGVLMQQCPSSAHPFPVSLILLLHPPHNLSPCLLIDL